MAKLKDSLPQESRQEFSLSWRRARGWLGLDVVDSAASTMVSAVTMRCCSWLQSLGLSHEVQQSTQDLPFEGTSLSEQTDSKLHSLKDSRTMLCSLGLYVPPASRKYFRSQQPPRAGALQKKREGL